MSSSLSVLTALPVVMVVLFMTMPVWFRLINEFTSRTIGKTLVICPHCGMPGVINATQPRVFR